MGRYWFWWLIFLVVENSLNVDGWFLSRRRTCTKVDCRLTSWSSWSACSKSCGLFANRERKRSILSSATCGGRCWKLIDSEICNDVCCPVNCAYTWGSWGMCQGSCGPNGEQTSLRIMSQNELCGGTCNAPPVRKRKCDTGK